MISAASFAIQDQLLAMDNKAVDRWTAEVQDSLHADDDIKQETVTTNESLCYNTSTQECKRIKHCASD